MPDSICTGARWITSTVIPIVEGLTWWLGVYGVSPNIVVCGRQVSNTNKGNVTLKEKDSKGISTVVLWQKIINQLGSCFTQRTPFFTFQFISVPESFQKKVFVCVKVLFTLAGRPELIPDIFLRHVCPSPQRLETQTVSHLLWFIRKPGSTERAVRLHLRLIGFLLVTDVSVQCIYKQSMKNSYKISPQ